MIKINGKLFPNTIHIIHIGRVNALRSLVALDLSQYRNSLCHINRVVKLEAYLGIVE
jgi:hypothetical protein